jgi:hypothetical protein
MGFEVRFERDKLGFVVLRNMVVVFVSKFMDDADTYIYVTVSHARNNLSIENHSNFEIW